jgi:cbb3-type cytochrome c oxidase subunit III
MEGHTRMFRVAATFAMAILMGTSSANAGAKNDAARGAAVFEENCVACHQSAGAGLVGTAPSLVNPEFLGAASSRFLQATISHGREGTAMPPFGDTLKPDEIKAVVAYLRSFAKAPGQGDKIDREKPAKGDAANGRQIFASICAGCHGASGEGYEAEGSGTAIGKPGFLTAASDGFIRATLRSGRSGTPMHGFRGPEGLANLSVAEIDDVITYLRTAPGK